MKTKGEETRHKILKITRSIFVQKGFQNTSISEIITATGVKKGNLYYHFDNKVALGLAVLNDAKVEFFQLLTESFIGRTPFEKIKRSIKAISEEMRKHNFVGGCLFGNTAIEMSDINQDFSNVICEVFNFWANIIEEQLANAQTLGLLDKTISTKQLAKLIVASIEGGIMLSKVNKNKKNFEDCMDALANLLKM